MIRTTILREIRLTAFELVIIPGMFVTTLFLISSKKFAKKVRNNLDTIKGDHVVYENL